MGRFILGAVFGGVVVIGGLVVGSALFPPSPSGTPAVAATEAPEVTAPEAVTPEAVAGAEAVAETVEDSVVAEAPAVEPVPVAEPADVASDVAVDDPVEAAVPEPEPVVEPEPAAEAPAETLEETPAEVATVDAAPEDSGTAVTPVPETAAAEPVPAQPAVEAEPPAEAAPQVMGDAAPDTALAAETEAAPEASAAEVAEVPAPDLPAEPAQPPVLETDAPADVADNSAPEAAPALLAEVAPEPEPPVEVAPDAIATPSEESVEPEQDGAPTALDPPVAEAPEALNTPETATMTEPVEPPAPEVTAEAAPDAAPDAPVAVEPGPEEVLVEEPAVEPEPEAEPEVAPDMAPEAETGTAELPGDAAPTMPGKSVEGLPGSAPEPAAEPVPEVAEATEPVGTFETAPGLATAPEGVIVGRLPKIGDAEVEAPAPTDEADVAPPSDLPPIAAYAVAFDNPDNKPILSIVLIDSGAADLDRASLTSLPFNVTIALDPMHPDTPANAAIYRAAGKEVAMLATGVAKGAQASDVEVAFQSMEQGLPEAVAVMDLQVPSFQDNRPLASLVVPVIKGSGRGLLTWDLGLNAADQVARREDVPAATIFRDLTPAIGDKFGMRRLMDRAIFKADQDGSATVVGPATPEMAATLMEWALEGRGAPVMLAPLTAVLTVD